MKLNCLSVLNVNDGILDCFKNVDSYLQQDRLYRRYLWKKKPEKKEAQYQCISGILMSEMYKD